MRILGIDLETTGLDKDKDFITEMGWAIIDTEVERPLVCESHILWHNEMQGSEFEDIIVELTHLTSAICHESHKSFVAIYDLMTKQFHQYNVDYVVAHNGNGFDKPFLEKYIERHHQKNLLPGRWIDTYCDIEYPKTFKYRNLTYLCGEHGFVNPFPHAALFDVLAMLKILRMYDIDQVVKRAMTPSIVVRALVSFEEKDEAKKRGYYWQECAGIKFPKCWVKQIKENELEQEQKEAPFEVKLVHRERDENES